jgi:branched-chain amino acid aminotransferase
MQERLYVPDSPAILPGITRDSIIKIAKDLGIPVILKRRTVEGELFLADEIFLTGTATEVAPVGKVSGRKIGNGKMGPMTALFRETYLKAVHGEIPRYRKWLTFVNS